MNPIIKVIARTPTAILCALGSFGLLFSMPNAAWLLAAGVGLQFVYFATKF